MTESARHINELVQQAAKLVKVGQKDLARPLLAEALALDSKRVDAWVLLAKASDSVAEEIDCLKRVVALDPNFTWAKQRLKELDTQSSLSAADSLVNRPALVNLDSTVPLTATVAQPPKQVIPQKPTPIPSRRKVSLWWLVVAAIGLACGLVWMVILARPLRELAFGKATPTSAAQPGSDLALACQRFIDQALKISNKSCSQVGTNKVCYGNNTLRVTLANNTSGQFSQQGDVIDANALKELSASPLNPKDGEWGIAIFKLLANLPRTSPGQNVTFVVFGNTTLTSNDPGLQAFYFSSGVGRVDCDQVPMDGIAVNLPQGGGVHFTVNGAEVTLLGNAALEAHPNDSMTVSVLSGSALVSADGVDRYFGAGQQVGVPLSGANGVVASGPPSLPSPLSAAALQAACTISSTSCNPSDIQSVDPAEAQAAVQQAVDPASSASAPPSLTPVTVTSTQAATATLLATATPLASPTFTPKQSVTPARTSIGTPSASPTLGSSPTPTATFTQSATSTRTVTSLVTSTASASATRTATRTKTPTPPATSTHTATTVPTFTSVPTSTPLPPTATFTATTPPTDTPTSTPTDTSLPPTPTDSSCNISANSFSSNGSSLSLNVQNNLSTGITITGATVNWIRTPPSQELRKMDVGGSHVWNGHDNFPPSNLPGGSGWSGPSSNRQIGPGSSRSITFDFKDNLQPSGYSVTLNFNNGCSVSAGN
jgi:hypothetical protein